MIVDEINIIPVCRGTPLEWKKVSQTFYSMKHKIGKNMGSRSIVKYKLMYINYINFCYTATSQKGYTDRNTPPSRSPATPQKMAGNQNQNFISFLKTKICEEQRLSFSPLIIVLNWASHHAVSWILNSECSHMVLKKVIT